MNPRFIQTVLFCILAVTLLWLFCALPSNMADNPKNSTVSLFLPDNNNTVQQGSYKQIGMQIKYPQHINFYHLVSTCGNFDTTIQAASLGIEDTVYFNPRFKNEGSCTFQVTAEYIDNTYKSKTDSIIIVVLPGEPTLEFSDTPVAFTTHTGATDTLRFVINASQVNNIIYMVTCNPEADSTEVHQILPIDDDTVLILFDPENAEIYTVTLNATAGDLSTSASVTVTVLESLAPNSSENPSTLITGTPDTLIFTLTPEQVAGGVVMQLLDALDLPAEIATIIPSGSDSILIAVNSAAEGTLSFSIVTTNGVFTDTTEYTFTFVDRSNAVWVTTSATIDALEGQQCSVDLTSWLFEGVLIETIAPTASVGSITSSGTWQYTPPWGSEASVPVTITGKRGETSQDLSLKLSVAPGDIAAPEITLLSPAAENKTVSSSEVSVSVIVKDAEAGVDKVTFTTGSGTVDGSAENDSTWTATITGLAQDTATEVTITAIDKSMKKNSDSKTITLTWDPTMEDGDAPVFTQVAGPESGDRVTGATGSITYTITDDSGVDSVWWTLNDLFVAAVTSSDSSYSISYDLPDFGANTIKLFAKDGATGGNEGSRTITLNYNTPVTAVTPAAPKDEATNVLLTPSFSWTGGTDADGDSVFYRVLYGTSATDLSQATPVLTSTNITLTSEEQLSPTTVYHWQVVAWSKEFPDTVRSDTVSFTTLDPTAEDVTGPPITQTGGTSDGDRVTSPTGSITVTIGNDPSGIASVTAKLNSGTAQTLTAGTNNTYSYEYTLSSYGENTVTFTAVDGSVNSNRSEEPVTFNYNTKPSAITLTEPAADASDVSVSPTFKWTGGDDLDEDGVTFTVHYGTSQTNLGSTAIVSGKTATVGSPLAYNQTYYWQVTGTSASADYPDEVESSVGSFTTEGSFPSISAHPQSQSREEGQSVTFSVTASANGFGTLPYQWRKNGTTNVGTDSTSYTITSVTTAMSGDTYDCVVTNDVGSTTSNPATLTVTAIPSFTVKFDMHGGDAIDSQTVLRDGNAQEPPTPQRTGYKFKGWYTSSTFASEFDFATPITANRTIHAYWVAVYTVTYHSNTADGGTVPTDSKEYESGEQVTVAGNTGNLNKDGFDFAGWTINSGGTGTVYNNPNTIQMGSAAINFYAKWEMNPPTITTSISNKTCPVNDSVTFTVGATGVNLSYVWQLNGSPIGGANRTSYTTSKLTKSDASTSRTYTCIVSNTAGSDDCSATLSVSTVSDIDNNVYHEVKIGTQIWMMENLKVVRFRNGTSIPNVTFNTNWYQLTSAGYCWYDNNSSYKEPYGALYNSYAALNSNIAPAGWHVPSIAEWTTLREHLGGWDVAGGKLKETGTTYWDSPNAGATNESGFSALGAGDRETDASFVSIGNYGRWWSTSEYDGSSPYEQGKIQYCYLWSSNADFSFSQSAKISGFSIRCVKD
ncbi:MAG: InlB B-repeat-containing protein [Chitinispirillaceae bacterium]|nr:InlB B-repeat-containing protein [Chitinispirillaceae bacterium]